MNKGYALLSLKLTGWLFIVLGLMALLSTIVYLKRIDTITNSIFKFLYGISMIFFGYLILSSRKVLK